MVFFFFSIYKSLDGHQDLVVNSKEILKFLKQKLQFIPQVIQIKPCGHHGRFFNKKQKKNLEDVNLIK